LSTKSSWRLGIRPLEFHNHSLLAKLGWKLTINAPSLWVEVLKGKYLENGISFLNVSPNPSSSWLWKGLLKNGMVINKGACISISNGANIDVWNSPWIPLMPDFKPIPNVNLLELPPFCVADLMVPEARSWNVLLLQDLFDPISV
jgi:hypothetical protein